MQAYFESIPREDSCPYCKGRSEEPPLRTALEAVYCISLQEQPERTRQAVDHFHRIGLCRHVTFYRAIRGKNGERAIWESHQAVARHALEKGCRAALVLEDDVLFRQSWSRLAPRIERAINELPVDWWSFYLGHCPLQAYLVRQNILRVRSLGAHAYIASRRLLMWLAETQPLSPEVATLRLIGPSLDSAMANLPGMYALFPMAALQRFLGDYRVDTRVDRKGSPRSWHDIDRWRYYFIFRGALLMEILAVLSSPFHRVSLEYYRGRAVTKATRTARLIRMSTLFHEEYYLQCRPDVALQEINPLWHYVYHGSGEGTWPCPLFDPYYYASQSPDLGEENPLAHFIRIGARRKPHPVFDTDFYLSRYGHRIPQNMTPLAHFLNDGGVAGFDPHPLFASEWYLSQHPEVRAHQENPLVHYLTAGWRQGAAPHPQFDGELYLHRNPDVKSSGINPLDHFLRHGQSEGRAQPRPLGAPTFEAANWQENKGTSALDVGAIFRVEN
jgi:hypothetical protein